MNKPLSYDDYKDLLFVPLVTFEAHNEDTPWGADLPTDYMDAAIHGAEWDYGDASPETALSTYDMHNSFSALQGVYALDMEGTYAVYADQCGNISVYVSEVEA